MSRHPTRTELLKCAIFGHSWSPHPTADLKTCLRCGNRTEKDLEKEYHDDPEASIGDWRKVFIDGGLHYQQYRCGARSETEEWYSWRTSRIVSNSYEETRELYQYLQDNESEFMGDNS